MAKKNEMKTEVKKKTRKKHKAVNFFLSLIIILAAAGAVFWFGWVQFSLGEGDYAVIYTKSNGYESKPLKNGEFAWRWQALLPTNLSLHIFNLDTRTYTIDKSGKLPSGDFYASITGEDINFDWNIKVKILYRLNPEALPSLVSGGLLSSGLDSYYSDFEARLNSEMINLVSSEVGASPDETFGGRIDGLEDAIRVRAGEIDSNFIVVDTAVNNWTYPDPALYAEARRLAIDLMNKRQSAMSEVEDSAIRREDARESRLSLLEEYGRILQEYPVLLDLFSLEGHPGSSLLPPEEL